MAVLDIGRLPGARPPVETGVTVDDEPAFGTALTGTAPRAALHLPQNFASAAFSNPHLHIMDRHLSRRITKAQSQ
jgi:hypothetical protein